MKANTHGTNVLPKTSKSLQEEDKNASSESIIRWRKFNDAMETYLRIYYGRIIKIPHKVRSVYDLFVITIHLNILSKKCRYFLIDRLFVFNHNTSFPFVHNNSR